MFTYTDVPVYILLYSTDVLDICKRLPFNTIHFSMPGELCFTSFGFLQVKESRYSFEVIHMF